MRIFKSVQYLRAVAAIMVVIHHAMAPADGLWLPRLPIEFLSAGVDIFFFISGFIIYSSQIGRDDAALSFLHRRMLRVVPLYWLATGALIALHLTIGIAGDMVLEPYHVLASLLLIPHYSPSAPDHIWPLLIPGWSLFYEVFFYALFGVGIALFRRRAAVAVGALLLLSVLAGYLFAPRAAILVTYTSPLLLEFTLGMVLGALVERGRMPAMLGVLAPLGMVLLALSDGADLPRIVAWGVPSGMIVAGALAIERWTWTSRILLLLGDASYSIYITHIMTLSVMRGVWRHVVPAGSHSPGLVALFVILAVGASIIGGILCYYLAERPLLRRAKSRSAKRASSGMAPRPVAP